MAKYSIDSGAILRTADPEVVATRNDQTESAWYLMTRGVRETQGNTPAGRRAEALRARLQLVIEALGLEPGTIPEDGTFELHDGDLYVERTQVAMSGHRVKEMVRVEVQARVVAVSARGE